MRHEKLMKTLKEHKNSATKRTLNNTQIQGSDETGCFFPIYKKKNLILFLKTSIQKSAPVKEKKREKKKKDDEAMTFKVIQYLQK